MNKTKRITNGQLNAALLLGATAARAGQLDTLRCEYLVDPLGIDETQPRLSWVLQSTERCQRQTAYQVLVASSPEALARDQGDLWDSGRVASDKTAQVVYAGKPLASRQACFWKIRCWNRDDQASAWSKPAHWEMGLLKPDDWSARWITAGTNTDPNQANSAVPMLRKTFKLADKPVAKARLAAAALGIYEVRLNGMRVGDHVLAPDWTEYSKRVRYQVYDVTAMLRKGENALAGLLANGWYAGGVGAWHRCYGHQSALYAQLEITYSDGTTERIATDETWKFRASPIAATDFMQGETYDAREETPGWDAPGLDDSAWAQASVREEKRTLDGQVMEPVRVLMELPTMSIKEPKPGQWTFDLGQNMVGVVRLKVEAPSGTKITLRYAEMLNPDGTIYTANLRSAACTDTYVCRGGGVETWKPTFTFHGFRYVEVTGLKDKPSPETVTGVMIGSDTPQVGQFACSDPRINQLHSNIVWSQRGNYLSVPTDCPQRDERLGWLGDAQVFVRTATYNTDVAAFFTKWMVDVDDCQTAAGVFNDISPLTRVGSGAPAWGDAGVICPWTIYQVYGDKRIIERHLPAMTRWIEYLKTRSPALIRDRDRGNDYGDWLSIGANTPKDLIGTAYFAYSTRLVAKAYAAIGKTAEAERYETLFQDIKAAFIKKYLQPDGRMHGNTQCCYAMALKFDLLPDEAARAMVVQHLEDDIKAKGWHLSTGFVGVSYLLPVLTQAGKTETAYKLLMQDTFPSWLFSVMNGATTIWERWDGWTPDKGFQDTGMNSFNHYSLGSCGQWLYETVAGIGMDPEKPGYRHVIIRPQVGGGLSWARASLHSIGGLIESGWKLTGGLLTLDVTIPANATATVYLPAADAATVTESDTSLAQAEGVKVLRSENGEMIVEIGSGKYRFAVKK